LSEDEKKKNEKGIEKIEEDLKNAIKEGIQKGSPKINNLNAALLKGKTESEKFETMERFLKELETSTKNLDSVVEFGKKLFELSEIAKEIHPNAPAAFAKYMNDEEKLGEEMGKILDKIKRFKGSGLIPADTDVDAKIQRAEELRGELKKEGVREHIERMHRRIR